MAPQLNVFRANPTHIWNQKLKKIERKSTQDVPKYFQNNLLILARSSPL
jgi:hypothetical protein